jgi:hypothetical protein
MYALQATYIAVASFPGLSNEELSLNAIQRLNHGYSKALSLGILH